MFFNIILYNDAVFLSVLNNDAVLFNVLNQGLSQDWGIFQFTSYYYYLYS